LNESDFKKFRLKLVSDVRGLDPQSDEEGPQMGDLSGRIITKLSSKKSRARPCGSGEVKVRENSHRISSNDGNHRRRGDY